MLCRIIFRKDDSEGFCKVDTTEEMDGFESQPLENEPFSSNTRTHEKVVPSKGICTDDTTKFYTIQLSDGRSVHVTCDDTDWIESNDADQMSFKVYRGNVLDCPAIQRAAQSGESDEAQFGADGSEVEIPKNATVELVGISFCFSFLSKAYSTNSSISK